MHDRRRAASRRRRRRRRRRPPRRRRADDRRRRVAVLGGGRSSEHDVSLASAASVASGLRARPATRSSRSRSAATAPGARRRRPVALTPGRRAARLRRVFPVLHGPFGEDGTVQGLLECLDVPYVGAGVLASARLHGQGRLQGADGAGGAAAGRLPRGAASRAGPTAPRRRCADLAALGLPVFVKPARLGSSVGICAVAERRRAAGRARDGVRARPARDRRGAARGLEVECSVLGNDDPVASSRGEIVLAARRGGWYDYEAKYTPGGMELVVPGADLRRARERGPRARRRRRSAAPAARAWRASTSSSTARRRRAGQRAQHDARLHRDERLRASCSRPAGVPYPELLDRLVELGARAARARAGVPVY